VTVEYESWKPIHSLPPHIVVLVALARSHIPVVAIRTGDGVVRSYHQNEDPLPTAYLWTPLPKVPE
jgi:hypothetical protein